MPIFDDETQRKPLMIWLKAFDGSVVNIVDYIQRSVLYVNQPPEIDSFVSQLRTAIQELGKQATDGRVVVDDKVNPILRLAILHQRHQLASQLEVYRDRALHPDLPFDGCYLQPGLAALSHSSQPIL